jgi:hypothetical protein
VTAVATEADDESVNSPEAYVTPSHELHLSFPARRAGRDRTAKPRFNARAKAQASWWPRGSPPDSDAVQLFGNTVVDCYASCMDAPLLDAAGRTECRIQVELADARRALSGPDGSTR